MRNADLRYIVSFRPSDVRRGAAPSRGILRSNREANAKTLADLTSGWRSRLDLGSSFDQQAVTLPADAGATRLMIRVTVPSCSAQPGAYRSPYMRVLIACSSAMTAGSVIFVKRGTSFPARMAGL